ncbi:MAG: hypothetical protein WCT18_02325 [Patescibacteria group bacterium]
MPIKTKSKTKKVVFEDAAVVCEKSERDLRVLKNDLHYYKGVAIMALVLIFCIFIAFSSLFCAMYIEVKKTQVTLNSVVNQLIVNNDSEWQQDDWSMAESDDVITEQKSVWPVVEFFGTKIAYPTGWAQRIDVNRQIAHFYLDGRTRLADSIENGDLRVFIKKQNDYEGQNSIDISVGDKPAIRYDFQKNNNDYVAVVVPMGEQYVEILFRTVRAGEILIDEQTVLEFFAQFSFVE